jgi:hypothetical protein
MNTPPPRKLDLRDALILVMATAAGLAFYRATAPRVAKDVSTENPTVRCYVIPPSWVPPLGLEWPSPGGGSRVRGVIAAARPFLVAWTLAFPLLRLRRPRPGWRELARQPGMVACGISTLVLMALLLGISLESALSSWVGPGATAATAPGLASPISPGSPGPGAATPITEPPLAAMRSALLLRASSVDFAAHAIAGAWLIMALGGWRRPERSGIDRLGRALGAAWIAMMVAQLVAGFI